VHQHGGGTIAVSSQQGASTPIITSGADVAGIGGFTGRESQVTVQWLAQAVRDGQIRWVLINGTSSGLPNDTRVGSNDVMSVVAKTCKKVMTTSSGTLYDCSGSASALAAAAG
jgi:hypothetical protein